MKKTSSAFLLSILILSLFSTTIWAQISVDNCGLTVNAGPDKLVCPNDPVTILEGTVGGSGLRGYEWSPEEGLSNPRVLRPSVTVSGPQCYVLTAKKKSTTNLIINGNFEMGPSGFTTDYVPGTTSCNGLGFLDCEGTYAVINNPQNGHANWAPCGDHTSGSGNMLVCNGAPVFMSMLPTSLGSMSPEKL